MDAEKALAELLLSFVAEVAEVERVMTQTNCDGIKSMLLNSDGTLNTIEVRMRDKYNNLYNLMPVPVIAVATPSLLYMKEISMEVRGNSVLRDCGERLRSFPTAELNAEGQHLRKMLANNNFNSDITITEDSGYTILRFTIYAGNDMLKEEIDKMISRTEVPLQSL